MSVEPRPTLDLLKRDLSLISPVCCSKHNEQQHTIEPIKSEEMIVHAICSNENFKLNPKKRWLKCVEQQSYENDNNQSENLCSEPPRCALSPLSDFSNSYSNLFYFFFVSKYLIMKFFKANLAPLKKRRYLFTDENQSTNDSVLIKENTNEQLSFNFQKDQIVTQAPMIETQYQKTFLPFNLTTDNNNNNNTTVDLQTSLMCDTSYLVQQQTQIGNQFHNGFIFDLSNTNSLLSSPMSIASPNILATPACFSTLDNNSFFSSKNYLELYSPSMSKQSSLNECQKRKKVSLAEYRQRKEKPSSQSSVELANDSTIVQLQNVDSELKRSDSNIETSPDHFNEISASVNEFKEKLDQLITVLDEKSSNYENEVKSEIEKIIRIVEEKEELDQKQFKVVLPDTNLTEVEKIIEENKCEINSIKPVDDLVVNTSFSENNTSKLSISSEDTLSSSLTDEETNDELNPIKKKVKKLKTKKSRRHSETMKTTTIETIVTPNDSILLNNKDDDRILVHLNDDNYLLKSLKKNRSSIYSTVSSASFSSSPEDDSTDDEENLLKNNQIELVTLDLASKTEFKESNSNSTCEKKSSVVNTTDTDESDTEIHEKKLRHKHKKQLKKKSSSSSSSSRSSSVSTRSTESTCSSSSSATSSSLSTTTSQSSQSSSSSECEESMKKTNQTITNNAHSPNERYKHNINNSATSSRSLSSSSLISNNSNKSKNIHPNIYRKKSNHYNNNHYKNSKYYNHNLYQQQSYHKNHNRYNESNNSSKHYLNHRRGDNSKRYHIGSTHSYNRKNHNHHFNSYKNDSYYNYKQHLTSRDKCPNFNHNHTNGHHAKKFYNNNNSHHNDYNNIDEERENGDIFDQSTVFNSNINKHFPITSLGAAVAAAAGVPTTSQSLISLSNTNGSIIKNSSSTKRRDILNSKKA